MEDRKPIDGSHSVILKMAYVTATLAAIGTLVGVREFAKLSLGPDFYFRIGFCRFGFA